MEKYQKESLLHAINTFGSCEIQVSGESMKPFILPGDTVSIAKTSGTVLPGQVVAFFNDDQLILHRVSSVRKGRSGNCIYKICGDSSPRSHGEIGPESVAGRVIHLLRKGEKHFLWFRYPFCLLTLLLGPIFRTLVRIKFSH